MGKYIARIHIDGVIQKKNETYSQEWLLEKIKNVTKDSSNCGLLLFIDSPGGSVYESDEIYVAVKKYREKTKRPVYAYFASLAASGGYYIGCSAEKIICNRNTLTGSIGVISGRFLNVKGLMEKYGIQSETIHAGKNKTMGSFDTPATPEQRKIMQSVADECYEQFTSLVAENRGLDIAAVKKLADGRIYTASQAKANGLADEIMTMEEAEEYIKEKLGDKKSNIKFTDFKYKGKGGLKKILKGSFFNHESPMASIKEVLAVQELYPAYIYEK